MLQSRGEAPLCSYQLPGRLLSFSTLTSVPARPILPSLAPSCRPDSTEVKASLVFGQPDPSALEILWALYRKVKASRWLLGHLSLADNSITSDGESRAPCLLSRPWRSLARLLGGILLSLPKP